MSVRARSCGSFASRSIATQTELAEALREAGYDVVQTTVSRDIAELGLQKVRSPSGRLVYAPPGAANGDRFRELALALRRWALTFEASGNLVVIMTPRGYATPLAEAIDEAGPPGRDRDGRRARTRSSSSRARASPAPSCATSFAATPWKEQHEQRPPSSPTPAGSTPPARSPG